MPLQTLSVISPPVDAAAVTLGAEGGTAADDLGGFFPDNVRGNRRQHVASGGDELVFGRQLELVAVFPEAAAEVELGLPAVGGEVAGCVYDGAGAHDTHGLIPHKDLGDTEAAVAVEQQPRGLVAAAGVAGEVETGPVAAGGPKAEGVRHAHVAAGGVAARQPYRCRCRWRRGSCCCRELQRHCHQRRCRSW